jgi:hypothetical protein
MRAAQTIARLAAFTGRGPGTDAERRAALWLAAQLREAGSEPSVETFWCRPNWALAHAWHVALGLAGTLVAVSHARAGLALVLLALASILFDEWRGVSLGRWLTPQRASQNVVARADTETTATGAGPLPIESAAPRTRLIITANYDAGPTAVIYGPTAGALRAALRRASGGRAPGWLAWLVLALAWIAISAALRINGASAHTAGLLAVVPSAGLVLALALLLEAAAAAPGPAAADNASGTAVALALFSALHTYPPRRLDVELVLCGAHEGGAIGLARHLRHRARRTPTIVVGVGACGAGGPRWWQSDGPLLPRRTGKALRAVAADLAARFPELGLRPHRGRGASPAHGARRQPAIALGALDADGLIPHSHRPDDLPPAIDAKVPEAVLEVGLLFVDALDARLGRSGAAEARTG